jgi:hypothetical protein
MQYGIDSFESINSWSDSNGIPWLYSYKGPQPQWSWKQWMVEHSGVMWPLSMWPTLSLEVWDRELFKPVVPDYFKIPMDQHIGIHGNIKCGMEFNTVKLCPSDVAIRVVEVSDGSMWTGEIVGERLGQCVGLVIWWKRALLRNLEGRPFSIGESSEGQKFSFPALVVLEFEFDEGDTSISYDNGPPPPPWRCEQCREYISSDRRITL